MIWDLLWSLVGFTYHVGKLAFLIFLAWAHITGRIEIRWVSKPKEK